MVEFYQVVPVEVEGRNVCNTLQGFAGAGSRAGMYRTRAGLAGFVDLIAADAEIGSGSSVAVINSASIAAVALHLAPVLRGVVFLGQPHLGHLRNDAAVISFGCTPSRAYRPPIEN